jgi:anaerobic dimethyl sulfoxide reductase subunit B (iron-sulfur subunit)
MYYLPVACQQCGHPGCAAACPEDAITKAPDGTAIVDPAKCTGCGDCVDGCPYSAIVLDRGAKIARKCDLCAERLVVGGRPACVAVCPARALEVIDIDAAPAAGLRDAAAAPSADGSPEATTAPPAGGAPGAAAPPIVLKPSAGTEPNGRFVLTRQPWRDVC